MRKIAILCLTFLTIVSCGEDIEFNTPAIQGYKDGTLWRANFYAADTEQDACIVQGGNNAETLTLITTRVEEAVFMLGGSNESEAIFVDSAGKTYSTFNSPDPSVQAYPAEGQIDIEYIDPITNSVTGTYRFTGFTANGLNRVIFSEGRFYKVPITNGIIVVGNGTNCQTAEANALTTEITYNQALEEDSELDFVAACNAYRSALVVKKNSCGDPSGALEALILGLECEQ